ncbi:MAG: TonB-dependent receptor, partial [Chitinophagaceae bacterium]
NFGFLEIIKGPGSSLYGAGTGGVVLAEHLTASEEKGAFVEYSTGNYGLRNIYGSVLTGTDNFRSKVGYQHQESSGYRVHSRLSRDVLSWTGHINLGANQDLKTTFVYSDLFYQTPGALTKAEYDANPRASRPGNAFFPGATTAQASINQKTFLTGASHTFQVLPALQLKTTLYGSYTRLLNPAIQNYGRVSEPHFGGRSTLKFTHAFASSTLTLTGGGEWQQGYTKASVHRNRQGVADTLQQYYEVATRQSLVFSQASWQFGKWTAVAGLSLNNLKLGYEAFFPRPATLRERTFRNKLAPRFALLRDLGSASIYSSISQGFSAPTTEEFFPSGGAANINLAAENGTNYDLGVRGRLRSLNFDINAFYFALNDAIVQRRTAGGGSEFINAGSTDQKGIETGINYPLLQTTSFIEQGTIWLSHTYHHFRYKNFAKDTFNLSGKKLPGIAPHNLSSGIDLRASNGLFTSLTYLYSSRLPVTDANIVFADAYHLLGAKVGFLLSRREKSIKLAVGADNLLDEKYSLGNDVNGFGGRFFNAAPRRNYYVSLTLQYLKK